MTFWLFKPTDLISSKNILPYKIKNGEELLNFLTVLFVLFLVYIRNKVNKEMSRMIMISGAIFILVLGVIFHLNNSNKKEELELPTYENSLSF